MGLFRNSEEQEREIRGGLGKEDLQKLTDSRLMMLAAWRNYIGNFQDDELSDEMFFRATGKIRPK